MDNLSTTDLGWVSGLLEGEGCFLVSWKKSKNGYPYPTGRISCNMCDGDVLKKLHKVLGVGCLRGPLPPRNEKHRPVWRFGINKRRDILDVLRAILPYMGERRSSKIKEIIETLTDTERIPAEHGTRHRYERLGCRCGVCKAANAKHHREARVRRKLCLTSPNSEETT